MARNPTTETAPTPSKTKRQRVADKLYLIGDGETVKHAKPGVTGLRFAFANGAVRDVSLSDFPADVREAATAHGLAQKLGDSYAGTNSVDEAISTFEEKLADLREGTWLSRSEGGAPRVSLLAAAVCRCMVASGMDSVKVSGEACELNETNVAARLKELTDEQRKAYAAMPEVELALREIQLERAKAKAEAATPATDAPTFGEL